ncbi:hypothetical protein TrVE_jg8533 [Triparma verrucosa]|uniref:AP2/ERF domain-containing protein n=1 Tax=Triparma verrucosa TaxID=1606542 RepID=A0A9W7FGA3_9STRA|nr:hypothetical protein TrVE_jg8533 [Triparma verrucosa]
MSQGSFTPFTLPSYTEKTPDFKKSEADADNGGGGLRIVSAPSSVESSVASPSALSHQLDVASPLSLHQLGHHNKNELDSSHSFILVPPSPAPKASSKKRRQYSAYTGVTYNKTHKKYQACLTHNRKQHYLGRFATETEAAWAYDFEAKRIKGDDWKNLNFANKAEYSAKLSAEILANRGPPTLKGAGFPVTSTPKHSTLKRRIRTSAPPPIRRVKTVLKTMATSTKTVRRASRKRAGEIDVADILIAFSKSP